MVAPLGLSSKLASLFDLGSTPEPKPAPAAKPKLGFSEEDGFSRGGIGDPIHPPLARGRDLSPNAPPPPVVSARDTRGEQVGAMLGDGKLDASEASRAVALAREDAKLAPGESDPSKLKHALTGLYVRSGVPLGEAERVADASIKLEKDPSGAPITVSRDAQPLTDADRRRIRADAESDVANNARKDKTWSMEDIKKDRAGFMRDCSQIDGDPKTTSDQTSCVGTSFVGGVILSKPEAAQELAAKLRSPAGQKEFPNMAVEPQRSALARIESGNFSPKDASILGNALVDGSRKDGEAGMTTAQEMALHGKLQSIGFTPPPMRQDVYGTENRGGTHATAYAGGVGYDPWPYPGSSGQATITNGAGAAESHGLNIGPRFGMQDQKRVCLERRTFDGNGGMTLENGYIDGQQQNPPLRARYTFDKDAKVWVREPGAQIPPGKEAYMPAVITLDPNANGKLGER